MCSKVAKQESAANSKAEALQAELRHTQERLFEADAYRKKAEEIMGDPGQTMLEEVGFLKNCVLV